MERESVSVGGMYARIVRDAPLPPETNCAVRIFRITHIQRMSLTQMSPTDPERDQSPPDPECVPGKVGTPPTSREPRGNSGMIWASTINVRLIIATSARATRETMRRAAIFLYCFFVDVFNIAG